ncbi:MAG: 4Fe-4S dicluster domain-containing protein [Chloroflexi bacterium]|nr:4Fe-4S dicluster domain-containing protein [Chloroflexota bacterium]
MKIDSPEYTKLLTQCIHCGLCLPACPTYAVFCTEMDAPRGRIALMRAAAESRIALNDPALSEHLGLCLACRACEPACPSGVQYGALVETARVAIERARKPGLIERAVRRIALREMLPQRERLRALARILRVYQRLGLSRITRALKFLPRSLRAMENILPPLPARHADYRAPAPAIGEKRGDVFFFHGCIQDAFLADVNAATIRVLQRNGFTVHFPRAQTCCGAPAIHAGDAKLARELARKNIDAFDLSHLTPLPPAPLCPLLNENQEREEGEARRARVRSAVFILNNAGGCGSAMKEYAHQLADEPAYAEKAKQFVARARDVSEFLAENLIAPPRGRLNARVTYVESCHLHNAQKVTRQPRELLRAIPGIALIELKQPEQCCGSAGVYNIVQPETAEAILDAKMQDVTGTRAEIIATTNTGCHMQMLYGARRAGLKIRVAHVVELLDEAYGEESEKLKV